MALVDKAEVELTVRWSLFVQVGQPHLGRDAA